MPLSKKKKKWLVLLCLSKLIPSVTFRFRTLELSASVPGLGKIFAVKGEGRFRIFYMPLFKAEKAQDGFEA